MIAETCSFMTERLLVRSWHHPPEGEWPGLDLRTAVAEIMTEPVTRFLPDGWQGEYSTDRAQKWIDERDNESPTLLVIDRSTQEAVGLIILFEVPADTDGLVSIRLGYLLAEKAWGIGLAKELLDGLVQWCRDQQEIGSIVGGAAPANEASQRVLEHLGFSLIKTSNSSSSDELVYKLQLHGR